MIHQSIASAQANGLRLSLAPSPFAHPCGALSRAGQVLNAVRGSFFHRDFTDETRAAASARLDLEGSSQGAGPVAHDMQAKAFDSLSWPKSFAVIFHHHSNRISFALQTNHDFRPAGMRERVAQAFLRNSVKVDRNRLVMQSDSARKFYMTVNIRPLICLFAENAERIN